MSLLGVDPGPDPECTCGCLPHDVDCALVTARFWTLARALAQGGPAPLPPCEGTGPHRIDCQCIASRTAHAMVNGDGAVFYPDSLDAARYFAQQYGARPLHPEPFREFMGGDL